MNSITVPPLVILSLDGFSREYLDRKLVPSLDLFAECGASAEYMFPSFPSKTFPNHYTIATGLYPESHGIVDNAIFDPKISPVLEDMKLTKFKEFYGGEPVGVFSKKLTNIFLRFGVPPFVNTNECFVYFGNIFPRKFPSKRCLLGRDVHLMKRDTRQQSTSNTIKRCRILRASIW